MHKCKPMWLQVLLEEVESLLLDVRGLRFNPFLAQKKR